jgi:hypothetical protein
MRGLPLRSAGGAGGAVGISKYNTASLNFSQSLAIYINCFASICLGLFARSDGVNHRTVSPTVCA